jgi:hypothetical protein
MRQIRATLTQQQSQRLDKMIVEAKGPSALLHLKYNASVPALVRDRGFFLCLLTCPESRSVRIMYSEVALWIQAQDPLPRCSNATAIGG